MWEINDQSRIRQDRWVDYKRRIKHYWLNITEQWHNIETLSFFQVGSTRVQLTEKQVIFESVPLNMPSIKTAVLHNTGQNHAYYQVPSHTQPQSCFCTDTWYISSFSLLSVSVHLRQVLDVCPLPGMVVSPSEGVVPSGGKVALKIHFNPDSVIKFDTRIEVRGR